MRCWFTCIVATLALISGASTLRAQDLPGKRFATGYKPMSPDVLATLPVAERYRAFLPISVDLSSRLPPPGHQGGLGSCTAWATTYARAYYVAQYEGRDPRLPTNIPSPQYVFLMADSKACEDGISFDDAFKVFRKGALSLAEFPYSAKCAAPPAPQIVAKARDFRVDRLRIVNYRRIDDIKGQLARGNPVLAVIMVSPAFENFEGDKTFIERSFPVNKCLSGE